MQSDTLGPTQSKESSYTNCWLEVDEHGNLTGFRKPSHVRGWTRLLLGSLVHVGDACGERHEASS